MHGNVWEWCADWYDSDAYRRGAVTDPTGPSSGSSRVLRGGSWLSVSRGCRSANRNHYDPAYADYAIGFRVVVSR
jgi:formylglycine-generating enzyme